MFFKPVPPPYDPFEWTKLPFSEKARLVCSAWAKQGVGTPIFVYFVYVLKILLYVGAWIFFCGFTPGMGRLAEIGNWWLRPEGFQKAILWSMLFEIIGLGCGFGPLTGRYIPPLGGALYFLRPGTTKLPLFAGLPLIGGQRRNLLDAAAYAATCACLVAALVSAHIPRPLLIAVAILVPVLGVLDKTLFLCARGEHYWTTVMVFVLASDFIPGAKGLHAALWFWAGVSKLNHHFPNVVGVMTSNSPLARVLPVWRLMYRHYPDDLSPSRVAALAGHAGTLLEFSVPVLLLLGRGGTLTLVGLVLMLVLHTFITSNIPMGVPLEWNVMMVYGGFFLFYEHAAVSVGAVTLPVAILLAVMCFAIPLLGNLFPSRVPFLLAMRYYAGNWACSVWLFRGTSYRKLDRLKKSSPWINDQLARLYDEATCLGLAGKVMAFRLMHLHGRALSMLVPRAVERFNEYEWVDGEVVAGMVLGWNFGEGHLHREELLHAVQEQCTFEEGELRTIMIESQPLGGRTLHYRIVDAKTGLIEQGHVDIRELRARQPWASAA